MCAVHTAHQFAVFVEQPLNDNLIIINDPIIYHRIVRVLKYTIDEIVILFNKHNHVQARLISYTKKECTFKVIIIEDNFPLSPPIVLGLPLLKGSDLDEAVSFATQVGVSEIQLLLTDRSQRPFLFEIEQRRLMRIVIAASEQSKRFHIPMIHKPIPFAELREKYRSSIFFFGMRNGTKIATLLQRDFMQKPNYSFVFMVGPEADFSSREYEQLKQWQAQDICLGPTVLRSCTAAGIGVNYLRTFTYSV
jgi:16S rRNA (uracil1498-N3)-methyltransferase